MPLRERQFLDRNSAETNLFCRTKNFLDFLVKNLSARTLCCSATMSPRFCHWVQKYVPLEVVRYQDMLVYQIKQCYFGNTLKMLQKRKFYIAA